MTNKKSGKMKFRNLLLMLPTTILSGATIAALTACGSKEKTVYWSEDIEKTIGLKNEDGKSILNLELEYDTNKFVPVVKIGAEKLEGKSASELFLEKPSENESKAKSEVIANFIRYNLEVAADNENKFNKEALAKIKVSDVKVEGLNYSYDAERTVVILQPNTTKISFKFKEGETVKFNSTVTMAKESTFLKGDNKFIESATENPQNQIFKGENINQDQLKLDDFASVAAVNNKFKQKKENALNIPVSFKEDATIDKIFTGKLLPLMKLLGISKSDLNVKVVNISKKPTGGNANGAAEVGDIVNMDIMLRGVKLTSFTKELA